MAAVFQGGDLGCVEFRIGGTVLRIVDDDQVEQTGPEFVPDLGH